MNLSFTRLALVASIAAPLLATVAFAFTPNVLFESDRILAIDKPAGIAHHNDEEAGELGIVSLLREYYQRTRGDDASRLYGVHRLDRVTSGILLFAKDQQMAGILSKQFRENQVIKYYTGISNKKPKKKKQGWVKGNMVRGRRKSWYLENQDPLSPSSKETNDNYAVTRFFSAGLGDLDLFKLDVEKQDDISNPKTCLLFRPHTGKTHQLRVAAKSLGLPLLGDPVYGGDLSSPVPARTFLHATAIHIPLSGDDKQHEDIGHNSVTIWCPPPFASSLWEESAQDSFESVVSNLFQKNCECPEIISKIRARQIN